MKTPTAEVTDVSHHVFDLHDLVATEWTCTQSYHYMNKLPDDILSHTLVVKVFIAAFLESVFFHR